MSQAVEIAAGALDAIPQLSVLGQVTGFRGPNAEAATAISRSRTIRPPLTASFGRVPISSARSICATVCRVSFKGSFNLYKATGRMKFVARSFSLAGRVGGVNKWRNWPKSYAVRV